MGSAEVAILSEYMVTYDRVTDSFIHSPFPHHNKQYIWFKFYDIIMLDKHKTEI